MEHLEAIATPTTFVCPQCRDALWRLSGSRPLRFICHAGHSITLRGLQHAQSVATDKAVWAAIRALQEKRLLLRQGAESLRAEGDEYAARQACAEADGLAQQERVLRKLVEAAPAFSS
ncbi:MAG: hypothetical protein KF891_18875 [Rhizobacter sp.]|nr:hypothetical protein [Rhizobacter sp.]